MRKTKTKHTRLGTRTYSTTHTRKQSKQPSHQKSVHIAITMDPETEFDTDMMILDYTCCKATYELLLSRIAELSDKPPREGTNLLSIFNSMHTAPLT